MKAKMIFAWYDFWVGLFWDKNKNRLYVFFIPTIGIVIEFKKKPQIDINDPNQPWNWRK